MERMTILVQCPGIIVLESATPIRAVGVLPVRRRTLVQEHDEACRRRLDAERQGRDALWNDRGYNPSDGLPNGLCQ